MERASRYASSGVIAAVDAKSVNSSDRMSALTPNVRTISFTAADLDTPAEGAAELDAQHTDAAITRLEDHSGEIDGTEFRHDDLPMFHFQVFGAGFRCDAAACGVRRGVHETTLLRGEIEGLCERDVRATRRGQAGRDVAPGD